MSKQLEVGKGNLQNIRVYVLRIQKYKFCLPQVVPMAQWENRGC